MVWLWSHIWRLRTNWWGVNWNSPGLDITKLIPTCTSSDSTTRYRFLRNVLASTGPREQDLHFTLFTTTKDQKETERLIHEAWTNYPSYRGLCACRFSCSVLSDSCNAMDCSWPGSSVHGIFLARILEWVAFASRDPEIKPVSPASPALQAEPLGKLLTKLNIVAY